MSEKESETRSSKKLSNETKVVMTRKKTTAEIEQEAYMARQYAIVIGELKSAEARNRYRTSLSFVDSSDDVRFVFDDRIRATRLRVSKSHQDEIDQIIAFQPNALSALRFEAFMTSKPTRQEKLPTTASPLHSSTRPISASTFEQREDPLTQIERRRVQNLLLDDRNLLVDRTG